MGTERVVEISRKLIAVLNTIGFIGHEDVQGEAFDDNKITFYRTNNLTSISVGTDYNFKDLGGKKESIDYNLNIDLEEIAELLETFFNDKLPNFSDNYHKDTLRVELEQLEARKKSIESLLNEKEL